MTFGCVPSRNKEVPSPFSLAPRPPAPTAGFRFDGLSPTNRWFYFRSNPLVTKIFSLIKSPFSHVSLRLLRGSPPNNLLIPPPKLFPAAAPLFCLHLIHYRSTRGLFFLIAFSLHFFLPSPPISPHIFPRSSLPPDYPQLFFLGPPTPYYFIFPPIFLSKFGDYFPIF